MTYSDRAYWLGFALGIGIGIGSFLWGCSWDRCARASLLGTYLTPLQVMQ